MSCFLSLLDHASLDSYRLGSFVPVVRYGRVLRAVKEVVANSSRNPEEIASHSLRIARAVADAVGRDISERVIKRKGRRRFDTSGWKCINQLHTRTKFEFAENKLRRFNKQASETYLRMRLTGNVQDAPDKT